MSVTGYRHLTERGYIGTPPTKVLERYMMIDNKVCEIHNVTVYKFTMGDVEDPDLYAAEPLMEWQNSEMGEWIMAKAVETPMWHRMPDAMQYGWNFAITAKLKGPDHTFWQLKWGSTS